MHWESFLGLLLMPVWVVYCTIQLAAPQNTVLPCSHRAPSLVEEDQIWWTYDDYIIFLFGRLSYLKFTVFKSSLSTLYPGFQAGDPGVILGILVSHHLSVTPSPWSFYHCHCAYTCVVCAVQGCLGKRLSGSETRVELCIWCESASGGRKGNLSRYEGALFQARCLQGCVVHRSFFLLIPLSTISDSVMFSDWHKGLLKSSGQLPTKWAWWDPNCSPCLLLSSIPPSQAAGQDKFYKTDHVVPCLKSFFCSLFLSEKKIALKAFRIIPNIVPAPLLPEFRFILCYWVPWIFSQSLRVSCCLCLHPCYGLMFTPPPNLYVEALFLMWW